MSRAILDFYDDPTGSVLRTRIKNFGDVPDMIKTAERLNPEALDKLPDHLFALVAKDNEEILRKYACIDAGNTALNVIYLMEQGHELPVEAQKVAANNLLTACSWYDLEPPNNLLKMANKKSTLKMVEKKKTSELVGTDIMPMSVPTTKKTASMQPHVEITGLPSAGKPAPAPIIDHYCLEKMGSKRFPIQTTAQVIQADAYFQENRNFFEPADRHSYCVKLASRAEELNVPISDISKKYGSLTYSPSLEHDLYSRVRYFSPGDKGLKFIYDLYEKQASMRPELFAAALERFDRDMGIWRDWDGRVSDPYYTTFGFEKEAAWSYSEGDSSIDEAALMGLLKHKKQKLIDAFGEEIVSGLESDPIGIFESLPRDSRAIIMRLGQQS